MHGDRRVFERAARPERFRAANRCATGTCSAAKFRRQIRRDTAREPEGRGWSVRNPFVIPLPNREFRLAEAEIVPVLLLMHGQDFRGVREGMALDCVDPSASL